jgi:hypothetical protein
MPNYTEFPNNYNNFFERPLVSESGQTNWSPLDVAANIPEGSIKSDLLSPKGVGVCAIIAVFGDGLNAIVVNSVCYLEIPFRCKIFRTTLIADTGTATVDVWKDAWDNHPPTNADSITGSSPLNITSGAKYENDGLDDWNKYIEQGNILGFAVEAVSGPLTLTATLWVTKEE